MLVRPIDVVAEYAGAESVADRQAAADLYRNMPYREICKMARALGYAGLDVGPNSVWNDYWHQSRN